MKKSMLSLILCVLAVALAGTVFAQGAPPPGPPPGAVPPPTVRPAPCIVPTLRLLNPGMTGMLNARLSLTDAQKTKIADLLAQSDKDYAAKVDMQVKATNDYAQTLIKDGVTEAELTAAAEKAMKAELALVTSRIQLLTELRALLTPDQNKTLTEIIAMYTNPWRPQPKGALAPVPPLNPPPAPPASDTK